MSRPAGLSAQAVAAAAPRRGQPRLTPRLELLGVDPAHAAALAESINASLPDLRFISWGQKPVTAEWAETFCRRGVKWVEEGECVILHAFERDGGAFVGRIDLHSFDFEAPRCEIGYVGDSRRTGRGLMREAVLDVVALAFEIGFMRVQALSDTRNERALRFARSLGFVHEGLLHAYERDPWGGLATQAMFAAFHPDAPPRAAPSPA